MDVPSPLEGSKEQMDGEMTLTKRKVCRTDTRDGQSRAHNDFLAAFSEAQGHNSVDHETGHTPHSPRVLRAMKTIAVVPERGQLHSDHSDRANNLLRETRSFDTGTQGA